jgi:hypothetical protein
LIGAIALAGLITTFAGWQAAKAAEKPLATLWLDVAKAGIQIVAVGVVGGALAQAWKAIADQREAAAATKAKIRAELVELVALYNEVKAVRRNLRGLGLDVNLYVPDRNKIQDPKTDEERLFEEARQERTARLRRTVGRRIRLTAKQASGYREQMRCLNTLQLGYEAKVRQFEQADLLGDDRRKVVENLKNVESYLNDLVNEWEERGWTIREGTRLDRVSDPLQALYRKATFRPNCSRPMRKITRVINRHLFGTPPKSDEEPSPYKAGTGDNAGAHAEPGSQQRP